MEDSNNMDKYVSLARQAIAAYVKNNQIMAAPKNLPAEFYRKKAGAFVTLYQGRELRGCVGTYLATKKNLAEEIISNAVASCSRDHRFQPVRAGELASLRCEVNILSRPRLVADFKDHQPKSQGLIARASDSRCGLLLPDLAGIETCERQILICCKKGSIDPREPGVCYYEFSAEKHE